MRIGRMVTRLLAAVTIVVTAAFGAVVATGSPALAAAGCYGDSCSGQDPSTAGVGGISCANDGRTVASATVDSRTWWGSYVDVGTLEVRWSPRCQSNWGRLSLSREASDYKGIYLTQDTGYGVYKFTAGNWPGSSPGVYWTPMIYSPVSRVYAHVDGVWPWTCNKCATGWM